MQAVVNVVIPVFAIVLAGYLCGRFKLLGPGGSEALNGFTYYAALPALFFGSLAKVELAQIFNWSYLGAYLLGMAVVGIAALIVGRLVFGARGAALAVQNMAALFSNTGYMGIPLAITAFGQGAALPAILATVVNGALIMGLYILWIEAERSEGSHLLHVHRGPSGSTHRTGQTTATCHDADESPDVRLWGANPGSRRFDPPECQPLGPRCTGT